MVLGRLADREWSIFLRKIFKAAIYAKGKSMFGILYCVVALFLFSCDKIVENRRTVTSSFDAVGLEKDGGEKLEPIVPPAEPDAPAPPGPPGPEIKDVVVPEPAGLTAAELAAAAGKVLEAKCERCHSLASPQGGFGTVMNTKAMLDTNRLLIAGKPAESAIFTRLLPQGNMPTDATFSDAEKKLIEAWIISLDVKKVEFVAVGNSGAIAAIREDLDAKVAPADRLLTRYFTLQSVYNKGGSAAELELNRQAFFKVINSLSHNPVVAVPTAIDAAKLIYRINLRDLTMTANKYRDVIRDFYPYNYQLKISSDDVAGTTKPAGDYDAIVAATGTSFFLVRMDWFNATALLPLPYAEFMELNSAALGTNAVATLETNLGVTSLANVTNSLVMRSGFKGSGVSSNNRVLERHTATGGRYYWLSYDFFDSLGDQNIFIKPLGPVGAGFTATEYKHDGGEVIFELPNGFMGFFLETATGVAIEKGPQGIVRNAEGPPEFVGAIINGISCFSCHSKGLLDKNDQVRAFVAASVNFKQLEIDKVNKLYVPAAEFTKQILSDSDRYLAAQVKAGIDTKAPDPITPAYRLYYAKMSRADVSAELNITLAALDLLLQKVPFDQNWGNLKLADGFVTRREFNEVFGQALEFSKGLGTDYVNPNRGDHVLTPTCMNLDAVFTAICTYNASGLTNNRQ
jgi:serine/threonine-protein kinase